MLRFVLYLCILLVDIIVEEHVWLEIGSVIAVVTGSHLSLKDVFDPKRSESERNL